MRLLTPTWTNRNFAADLFDEMDSFFEDFNRSMPLRAYDERDYGPACDISETETHYLMSVDLPGMKKEDIKIELTDDVLTVSGERKREVPADKNEKVQRYEKSYGFFRRSFTLPSTVDAAKVEAHYEDGVLELALAKTESAKPRQIEIHAGKSGVMEKLLGSKKHNSDLKDVTSAKKS